MKEKPIHDAKLRGMWRGEYSRAKILVYWGYIIEFITAIFGVWVVGFLDKQYHPIASLIIALMALSGFMLKKHYDKIRIYAEKARRITFFTKALNFHLSEKKYCELKKPFSRYAKLVSDKQLEENLKYFSTSRDYGPAKLLEMLQESAFWNFSLMEKTEKYAAIAVIIFGSMLLTTLYIIAFVTDVGQNNLASNLIIAAVLFFITSGFWNLRNTYRTMSQNLKQIDDELENIRNNNSPPKLMDLFSLLNNYDCMMMEVPIVPDFIYKINKTELDNQWNERLQEYNQ